MLPEQWETFKRAARLEKLDKIPMALIIDSPWMPGYLGIKHLDYYLDPELWFQSNLKIMREFPDIIFVPSWWMEYGMAAEPSVLGAKIKFWQDNTPSEYHTLYHLEDIDQFPEYEVEADAFAALTLHRIGMQRQRILDHGYILPMVTSRGPLCTAGFRPRHHAFHDRPGGKSRGRAQADRPLHPRGHRLAQGAAQSDGRHGGEHFHPRRHRRLHQRRALHGVRASLPQADLRRVSRRTGSRSTTTTPKWTPASTICRTPASTC